MTTTQVPVTESKAPVRIKFEYHASLDGLRALALLAIIAYHFNYAGHAARTCRSTCSSSSPDS